MADISGCGFDSGAGQGKILAGQQFKIGLKQALLNEKNAVAAAKQNQSNMETAQPSPVTSEIAVQPVVAQPAPAEPILQSSPFHCDHSCPIVPSAPVIKVCSAEILCATVSVTPVATMKTAPVAPALDKSTPIIPVLLLGGLVFWLVFRG